MPLPPCRRACSHPKPGERIADLCAAPGGKTAQLAAAGADVLAVDRSAKRLKRLQENLARLDLSAATRAIDAEKLDEPPFDAILLDAPCSATGTIRRHPDVAWTKTEEDVRKLSGLQARLLDKAANLLKAGGRLVYCTCSLEAEEGERQVEAFLARHPDFKRQPDHGGRDRRAGRVPDAGRRREDPALPPLPARSRPQRPRRVLHGAVRQKQILKKRRAAYGMLT